jgi:hypothetical protein
MKNVSENSHSLHRHLNPGPPEYEVGTILPRRSVIYFLTGGLLVVYKPERSHRFEL